MRLLYSPPFLCPWQYFYVGKVDKRCWTTNATTGFDLLRARFPPDSPPLTRDLYLRWHYARNPDKACELWGSNLNFSSEFLGTGLSMQIWHCSQRCFHILNRGGVFSEWGRFTGSWKWSISFFPFYGTKARIEPPTDFTLQNITSCRRRHNIGEK